MRVLDDQLAQIVQAFADQHRHDVRMDDRRVVGPAEDLHGVGGERAAEVRRVAARHDEFRELDDHRNPPRRRRARQPLQVERAQQVAIDELERRARLAREREGGRLLAERPLQPVTPVVRAACRAHAAAAVVAQHDVVGREHHLFEERRHR